VLTSWTFVFRVVRRFVWRMRWGMGCWMLWVIFRGWVQKLFVRWGWCLRMFIPTLVKHLHVHPRKCSSRHLNPDMFILARAHSHPCLPVRPLPINFLTVHSGSSSWVTRCYVEVTTPLTIFMNKRFGLTSVTTPPPN
jgi:hypothetical protein